MCPLTQDRGTYAPFHLFWVYDGDLRKTLHAATWLETTRELRQMGWRVTLVAAGPEGLQPVRGVEVMCIAAPNLYFIGRFLYHVRVLLYLFRIRPAPDVLLFREGSAMFLLPVRLVRLILGRGRAPLCVMDQRSLHMPPPGRQGWRGALLGLYKQLMGWAGNRWADGLTAGTARMARAAHIPPAKLWGVWSAAVNPAMFASASVGRVWPADGAPIQLIYIGSLNYERNLSCLCRAVELANAEGLSFVLTLVGEGAESADLERLAEASSGQIRCLRPVPHEQIPAMLSQSHVGVLPFPDEEKFRVSSPIKLFEYMAAGLPILATRIVCHTDFTGEGEYVFWAEGSDVADLLVALRLAWQQRSELSTMSAKSVAAASQWTWHKSALRLKEALEYGLDRAG